MRTLVYVYALQLEETMKNFTLLLIGVYVLVMSRTNAIVMRHDVPEQAYRDFGEHYRQQLVQLGLPAQATGEPMLYSGMGALIAPNWVATAAHAAAYLQNQPAAGPNGKRYVFVKGRAYYIADIFIHPGYDGKDSSNDIALIKLEHPVREAAPACLYEKADEKDQIVALVGTGVPGDGVKGLGVPDGALRGSTERVDTATGTELTWVFRKPGDPRTTPLEGISGGGDSGGPAFIAVNGLPCLAGISSGQRIPPDESGKEPLQEGQYGVTEVYTRVSQYVAWIKATMGSH